jgi:hypothetical protein
MTLSRSQSEAVAHAAIALWSDDREHIAVALLTRFQIVPDAAHTEKTMRDNQGARLNVFRLAVIEMLDTHTGNSL